MRTFRLIMLASFVPLVCAGATTATLVDTERTGTSTVVVATPTSAQPVDSTVDVVTIP